VTAHSALNKTPVYQAVAIVVLAIRAPKTSRPSKLFQIFQTGFVVRETLLKIKEARELGHRQETLRGCLYILRYIVNLPQKDRAQTRVAIRAYLSREAQGKREIAETVQAVRPSSFDDSLQPPQRLFATRGRADITVVG